MNTSVIVGRRQLPNAPLPLTAARERQASLGCCTRKPTAEGYRGPNGRVARRSVSVWLGRWDWSPTPLCGNASGCRAAAPARWAPLAEHPHFARGTGLADRRWCSLVECYAEFASGQRGSSSSLYPRCRRGDRVRLTQPPRWRGGDRVGVTPGQQPNPRMRPTGRSDVECRPDGARR